jgi:hypothetical protein
MNIKQNGGEKGFAIGQFSEVALLLTLKTISILQILEVGYTSLN